MSKETAIAEKRIGRKYAGLLQSAIRSSIQREAASFTTLALQTKVMSRMKHNELQRLVLESPKHSFIHHFGFEGIRSNGRRLSLEEKGHLSGLKELAILNGLATEISEIRAEDVIAKINF